MWTRASGGTRESIHTRTRTQTVAHIPTEQTRPEKAKEKKEKRRRSSPWQRTQLTMTLDRFEEEKNGFFCGFAELQWRRTRGQCSLSRSRTSPDATNVFVYQVKHCYVNSREEAALMCRCSIAMSASTAKQNESSSERHPSTRAANWLPTTCEPQGRSRAANCP